jgi:hypothetical protein
MPMTVAIFSEPVCNGAFIKLIIPLFGLDNIGIFCFYITMLKKVIFGITVILILSIAGFILFFPLDSFVKGRIDKALGPIISIKNLKIGWNAIVADDILVKTPSGTDFLEIKQLRLKPYLWTLLRKKFDIKEIEMESPRLVIKRTKGGKWLFPEFKKKEGEKPAVELVVKAFKVSNGNVIIEDDLKGFNMKLTDVAVTMKSGISLFQSGKTTITASAKFPDTGNASLKSEGNISEGKFKGTLTIMDLNMTVLRPYMKGDVVVKKGRLNLDSNFDFDKGYVKAPSLLRIRDMDIETRGFLMGIGAPIVIELVKKKGEIVLNFNIWGKWNNLQHDMKESFKRKVSEELGRTITSPLEQATKPLQDVLKDVGGLLPTIK